MKRVLMGVTLCASLVLAQNEYKYEVTPLVGGALTEGNLGIEKDSVNYGISLGINQDVLGFDQIEIGLLRTFEDSKYDNNLRKTGITRVFTNFVKHYNLTNSTSLYGLVGVGSEFFDEEIYKNKNGFYGNYGVGIKQKIYNDISLKLDVRHLIEADYGNNTLLYTAGLVIPFGLKEKPEVPVIEEVVEVVVELDSDNDKVYDKVDKCLRTPAGNVVDEYGCTISAELGIEFAYKSAQIENMRSLRITEFVDLMKKYSEKNVVIKGHTDGVGSNAYNDKLSLERANAVKELFVNYGINESRITTIGYGKRDPIATNETEEGRTLNRRVEAIMVE